MVAPKVLQVSESNPWCERIACLIGEAKLSMDQALVAE